MSAAAPAVPRSLESQLADDVGRIVLPVGTRNRQTLQLWRKNREGGLERAAESGPCRFVPLLGKGGWRG